MAIALITQALAPTASFAEETEPIVAEETLESNTAEEAEVVEITEDNAEIYGYIPEYTETGECIAMDIPSGLGLPLKEGEVDYNYAYTTVNEKTYVFTKTEYASFESSVLDIATPLEFFSPSLILVQEEYDEEIIKDYHDYLPHSAYGNFEADKESGEDEEVFDAEGSPYSDWELWLMKWHGYDPQTGLLGDHSNIEYVHHEAVYKEYTNYENFVIEYDVDSVSEKTVEYVIDRAEYSRFEELYKEYVVEVLDEVDFRNPNLYQKDRVCIEFKLNDDCSTVRFYGSTESFLKGIQYLKVAAQHEGYVDVDDKYCAVRITTVAEDEDASEILITRYSAIIYAIGTMIAPNSD